MSGSYDIWREPTPEEEQKRLAQREEIDSFCKLWGIPHMVGVGGQYLVPGPDLLKIFKLLSEVKDEP